MEIKSRFHGEIQTVRGAQNTWNSQLQRHRKLWSCCLMGHLASEVLYPYVVLLSQLITYVNTFIMVAK